VGNIEKAGALANGLMFLLDAGVLDGHPPAGKWDEPSPQSFVLARERRFA
jgi:hypothetical protein